MYATSFSASWYALLKILNPEEEGRRCHDGGHPTARFFQLCTDFIKVIFRELGIKKKKKKKDWHKFFQQLQIGLSALVLEPNQLCCYFISGCSSGWFVDSHFPALYFIPIKKDLTYHSNSMGKDGEKCHLSHILYPLSFFLTKTDYRGCSSQEGTDITYIQWAEVWEMLPIPYICV